MKSILRDLLIVVIADTCSRTVLRLWDRQTPKLLCRMQGHGETVVRPYDEVTICTRCWRPVVAAAASR